MYFSLWLDGSLYSNDLLFLSFQIIQKMHKRAGRQAFFLFLTTKGPCHPKKASLTKEYSTHDMPKKDNRNILHFMKTEIKDFIA